MGAEDRLERAHFVAHHAVTGEPLTPVFQEAEPQDVADACRLAAATFAEFSELVPANRATFLEQVAAEIAALGDILIERAMAETGLPRARLEGTQGKQRGWMLGGHGASSGMRSPGVGCSYEFKLSHDGTQIVCGNCAVQVECAGGEEEGV